jgi:hypothetical protein
MSGPDLVAFTVLVGGITGVVGIIGRTVVRYQDRKLRVGAGAPDPALRAELEDLRAQLAEHEDVRQRVLELEERVDFAERLLARQRDRAPLPRPE